MSGRGLETPGLTPSGPSFLSPPRLSLRRPGPRQAEWQVPSAGRRATVFSFRETPSMFLLRLLVLALAVLSTSGCSSLTSCCAPGGTASYPPTGSGYPCPAYDGGGPAAGAPPQPGP